MNIIYLSVLQYLDFVHSNRMYKKSKIWLAILQDVCVNLMIVPKTSFSHWSKIYIYSCKIYFISFLICMTPGIIAEFRTLRE